MFMVQRLSLVVLIYFLMLIMVFLMHHLNDPSITRVTPYYWDSYEGIINDKAFVLKINMIGEILILHYFLRNFIQHMIKHKATLQ